uniref:TetR family transcriptional regulator n=1 Tax=Desulfobacca acetoxidans TaxID=60893 RepID=A0A7V4LCN9_9BACT
MEHPYPTKKEVVAAFRTKEILAAARRLMERQGVDAVTMEEIAQAAVMEAQRAVLREAPGSGTTVTAALVLGQQLTISHVGDSRAYLLYNEQRMEAITRDHSLVRRLEELGQITSAEAAVHPQRNVLYRALGQGDTLEPDVVTTPFPVGRFLTQPPMGARPQWRITSIPYW